jgi:ribosome-binding factor A
MTNRMARVRNLLRQEIGTVLERDFQFDGMLITVTDVDVTPDLHNAHVYLSILGSSPKDQDFAFEKIRKSSGRIGERVYSRVTFKNSPRLNFRRDDSTERGVNLVKLIEAVDLLPTAPPEEEVE